MGIGLRNHQDTAAGLVMLALGGALWIEVRNPRYEQMGVGTPFDPVMYPTLLLYAWTAIALGLTASGVFGAAQRTAGRRTISLGRLLLSVAAVAGYLAALMPLGFLASSVVFALVFPLVMGGARPLALVSFAVFLPLATWYVFVRLLQMPLPAGTLLEGI